MESGRKRQTGRERQGGKRKKHTQEVEVQKEELSMLTLIFNQHFLRIGNSTAQEKHDVSHICNLKSPSSHTEIKQMRLKCIFKIPPF